MTGWGLGAVGEAVFALAVETAGYLYEVPLRALHVSGNYFFGLVLGATKDQVGRGESTTLGMLVVRGDIEARDDILRCAQNDK